MTDLFGRGPVSSVITSLPGSPADGDRYLVAASGTTGPLVGKENQIAERSGGAWTYSGAPSSGTQIFLQSLDSWIKFLGGVWLNRGPGAGFSDIPAFDEQRALNYESIKSAYGPAPQLQYGRRYMANDDAGNPGVIAIQISELVSGKAGATYGALHEGTTDGDFLNINRTMNNDGSTICGVGASPFLLDIAGVQDLDGATIPRGGDSGDTPTIVSPNTFTVPGNRTSYYTTGIRVRLVCDGLFANGEVVSSSAPGGNPTTVTLNMLRGQVLSDPVTGHVIRATPVFGERLSAFDPDHPSAVPIAGRNGWTGDPSSLDVASGIGLSVLNTAKQETTVTVLRGGFRTRTAGSETTRAWLSLMAQGVERDGPIFELNDDMNGNHLGMVPGMYAVGTRIIKKATNYSMVRADSGTIIENTSARDVITITLPNLLATGGGFHARVRTGRTVILQSGLQWAASNTNSGAYYLRQTGGGDPTFVLPIKVMQYRDFLTKGTFGSLNNFEWQYGDVESPNLGFKTIYVKLSGDPTGLPPLFCTYPLRVSVESTIGFDGIYYHGASEVAEVIESDGEPGSAVDFVSFRDQSQVQGWQGRVDGSWVKV